MTDRAEVFPNVIDVAGVGGEERFNTSDHETHSTVNLFNHLEGIFPDSLSRVDQTISLLVSSYPAHSPP